MFLLVGENILERITPVYPIEKNMATATQSLTVLSQFADWPHGREGSLTVGPNKVTKIDTKSARGKCGGPQKGDGRSGQQDWSEGVRVAKVSFLSIWGGSQLQRHKYQLAAASWT